MTWTERTSAGQKSWQSIASSSDGTKLAATISGGYIVTSTDSGVTWIDQEASGQRSWQSITSSSDGSKLAAVAYGDYIYTHNSNIAVTDTTPPIITSITSVPTQTSSVISWTTDEAATSQVEYGLTTSYGTSTVLDTTEVTSHEVAL